MRGSMRQSGFSLLEVIAVLAIILILAGALLGVSKYLTERANVDLTTSELQVLATALQQYYDDFGDFPFETDIDGDGDSYDAASAFEYKEADMESDLNGALVTLGAIDGLDIAAASSSALFYFLDKNPDSRMTVEALTDTLISSKDAADVSIQITIGTETIDLPRFIDAWGTSIRYEYIDGTAFPILTSAGPDADFATAEDNIVCP